MTRSARELVTVTSLRLGMAAVLALLPPAAVLAGTHATGSPTTATFGVMPLYFESNRGQGEGPFQFIARGRDCNLFVAATEAVLMLGKPDVAGNFETAHAPVARHVQRATRELRLEFVGAKAAAPINGLEALPGRANYFLGNDPSRWRTDVPLFGRVQVDQLYPGVDLVYYGTERRLEYDFIVAPKASTDQIALRFTGADRVRLSAEGDLIFTLGNDEIRQPKPFVYQLVNGRRSSVAGSYVLTGRETVAFKIGEYDAGLPLVIDPVLTYASYFGGSGVDVAWDVAVDGAGFVYVAGESMGGLPVRAGTATNAFSGSDRSRGDAFVAKFDNAGTNLIYLAYLGGRTVDVGLSLAVDAVGSVYLTGFTDSTNFPTTNALFSTITGKAYPGVNVFPTDAFVTKLAPSGTSLVYSTYLGGEWLDTASGIAIDPAGNAYIAGYTASTNLVTANVSSELTNYGGGGDAFVAKIGAMGTNLVYCCYLGGTNQDVGWDVAANADGVAFVTGFTRSTNFAAAANFPHGGSDVFITTVGTNAVLALTNLTSIYFGGAADNEAYRLALNSGTNLYVLGTTTDDPSFPVTPSELNPGGVFRSDDGATNWSAFSAGLASVVATSFAIDPANPNLIVAGTWRGVAMSQNAGASWTTSKTSISNSAGLASAVTSGRVLSVALLGGSPLTILAGTDGEGVLRSSDGGLTWLSSTGLLSRSVGTLAVVPSAPPTVYAGTEAGVFKSTDGGTNWTVVNGGLGTPTIYALVADPANPLTVYAGTAAGVYRTIDGGTNWSAFNSGLSSTLAQSLAIHPWNPAILYVGTAGGVFKTEDRGTNWGAFNAGLGNSNVLALAIDPASPDITYAGTTNGLFKRVSDTNIWTQLSAGLGAKHVLALAISPNSPATLYAGTRGVPFQGGNDAFLAKLSTTDRTLQYCAVWGGSSSDKPSDVAIDAAGGAHVTGRTLSTNFPTVAALGILRATNSGGQDAFVAQLSSDGRRLEHSAYLGGSDLDTGYGIALDSQGNSFVVGVTASANFPTFDAYQGTASGSDDAFLVRLSGESRPRLSITLSTKTNEVARLTWPGYWEGYTLQGTLSLYGTNPWVDLGDEVKTNGSFLRIFDEQLDGAFFRLQRK